MPENIFIDITFIIVLIDIKNSEYQQAVELINKIKNPFYITTYDILSEATKNLSYQDKLEMIRLIETFIDSQHTCIVESTEELFKKSLAMYKENKDKEWSLAHCFSFVVMRDKGIKNVLTFDKYFTEAGFHVLPDIYK